MNPMKRIYQTPAALSVFVENADILTASTFGVKDNLQGNDDRARLDDLF